MDSTKVYRLVKVNLKLNNLLDSLNQFTCECGRYTAKGLSDRELVDLGI